MESARLKFYYFLLYRSRINKIFTFLRVNTVLEVNNILILSLLGIKLHGIKRYSLMFDVIPLYKFIGVVHYLFAT